VVKDFSVLLLNPSNPQNPRFKLNSSALLSKFQYVYVMPAKAGIYLNGFPPVP